MKMSGLFILRRLLLSAAVFSLIPATTTVAGPLLGGALYEKHCSGCHGNPLKLKRVQDIVSIIRMPPAVMPAFGEEKISPEAARAIEDFIKSPANVKADDRAAAAAETSSVSAPPVTTSFAVTGEKPAAPVKIPRGKKSKLLGLAKQWALREPGNSTPFQEFQISVTPKNELNLTILTRLDPKGLVISRFEVADSTLKFELKWKMNNASSYWKIDTYDLTMSDDGKKLTGTCLTESPHSKSVLKRVVAE